MTEKLSKSEVPREAVLILAGNSRKTSGLPRSKSSCITAGLACGRTIAQGRATAQSKTIA